MRVINVNSSLDQMLFKPNGLPITVWKGTVASIFFAIIIFTTLTNFVTLIVAVRMKQFHNSVSNLYIASLAGADLVVGACVMTFRVLYTVVYEFEWVFGQWLCNFWQILDFASCSISLYSICAIAFDRWFNLQKPLRIFKRSRKLARRTIFVIWTLPVILSITAFCTFGQPTLGTMQCSYTWEYRTLLLLFIIAIYYIPILLLLIMFMRIAYVIRKHMHFLQKHSNRKTTKRIEPDLSTAMSSSHSAEKRENVPLGEDEVFFTGIHNETERKTFCNGSVPDLGKMRLYQKSSNDFLDTSCHEVCFDPKSDRTPSGKRSTSTIDKTLLASSLSNHWISDCKTTSGVIQPKLPMHRNRRNISRQLAVSCGGAGSHKTSLPSNRTKRPVQRFHRSQTETALLRKPSGRASSEIVPAFLQRASLARQYSSNLFSEIIPNATNNLAHQVHAARAVGIMVVCFLLCWLPFIIIWPMRIYCPSCISDGVYDLAVWTNHLSSTINPIMYALCSPRFQHAIRQCLSRGNRLRIIKSFGRSTQI